jgi:hypothetical protein
LGGFRSSVELFGTSIERRPMNGVLKVVLKLPSKAGVAADSDSQQTHKDSGKPSKKKRKLEGGKSSPAFPADRQPPGGAPLERGKIAGTTSQGIANGGGGFGGQPKPRISIKYVL